ncbi:dual specificity protein kinase Ttk [Gadus chalcogrammus]|uniref:dual specificity protein kinase Ttk n=1 Tax=Gadus chalcogrammus TaxID=1042646 RepID=UPI0024C48EB1|nr:dual specificity protein kinase Ttk [Gadus chalcogrammus]XP_056458953.1 dual specificity protein kinase Ttk [Gadus chalcogrammus]
MEEEEHTDREQQRAMFFRKLDKLKKNLNEDDTDNINQVIGSNSPESCLTFLLDLEKKSDPNLDHNHLTRLLDFHTRVFSSLPMRKHCLNESYARLLVRYAELEAIQDVNEAEAHFIVATSHSQNFAFVHIAYANFEHAQGNTRKSINILLKAMELNAKPKDLLALVLKKLQKTTVDKENLQVNTFNEPVQRGSEYEKMGSKSDGTGEFQLSSNLGSGTEYSCPSSDDHHPGWRSGSHHKRTGLGLPGRVPIIPYPIAELASDDGEGNSSRKSDAFIPNSLSRQTSGSSSSAMGTLTSAKKLTVGGDFLNFKRPDVSPEMQCWKDQASVDSTPSLHRQGRGYGSRMEDITLTLNQMGSSNSPKSCWDYLLKLEKTGNPQTDRTLLTQLKDCYAKVFSRLPIEQYTKNESYAKILVRYAELKGIEDSDDAKDHFIVARSNYKYFAFVHIAHAQFEASQGNIKKATSILSNAQALNAKPPRLLELALQNLKAGAKRLVPKEEEEEQSPVGVQFQSQGLSGFIPRPLDSIPIPALHVPTPVLPIPTPVLPIPTPVLPIPTPFLPIPTPVLPIPTPTLPIPSRLHPSMVWQTPNNQREPYASSFVTPSVRKDPPDVAFSASQSACAARPPSTPVNQVSYSHIQQNVMKALSNESITIKGKEYFILKMIGQGGSSKVYQVLDHKKQLYAVKCVNLEEADPQTVESYKNEIEHLMRLQQFSDQIIKLYDYEITDRYIYMLMECGNLDLNTWLRNRKQVLPLERKFYWKNMLEAVHTIHNHGIIHSDLKPANFVIVNASLKLIDFGIANSIQPDVTSIMKDSQVGTLNYMPPEAIKDTSSQPGKASSKISPKGDVWSLGCILYCMTYRRTPFQSITNQIAKLQAIIDPSHKIEFPDIAERDLQDVLKRCLVRNPRERISIAELLEHAYLQLDSQPSPETRLPNSDLERILTDLAALNSPNSIVRAANNLAKMCNSGRRLDVAECVKSSSQLSWKM